MNVNINKFTFY